MTMSQKTKKRIVLWACLSLPIVYVLVEWCFFSGGIKRLYYFHVTYDENKVRVVEAPEFPFYQEGYSQTYELNSTYYLPHRILLIPESKQVPVDYQFTGSFLIKLFDSEGTQLNSFTVERAPSIYRDDEDDYYGNYLIYHGKQRRAASSVFAFELGDIPFDLIRFKWGRLKDMKIEVTITKPDEELQKYCGTATFVIIPDLRLW